MERERLSHLIEEPGRVSREDLADLRALVERYPWFSGAQVLRAAGERASGDVLAGEPLLAAAVHVPSRAVLFDLCEPPRQEAAGRPEFPAAVIVPPPVAPEASKPPSIGSMERTTVVETMAPAIAGSVDANTAPDEAAVPAAAEGLSFAELQANDATAPPSAKVVPPQQEDPLERQILEAAIASAYDLTLHAPAMVEATAIPEPEVAPAPQGPAPPPPPVHTSPEGMARPGAALPATGRRRFTAWLDAAAVTSHEPAPMVPLPDPAPAPPKAAAVPQPALDSKAIIDRFIGQESPAPVAKATFFTPQQAAKKSLDDTAGMVTETLARIYAKQGNTAKAIEAYRKLALKYPEKSAYFAALSRELEAQQHK